MVVDYDAYTPKQPPSNDIPDSDNDDSELARLLKEIAGHEERLRIRGVSFHIRDSE